MQYREKRYGHGNTRAASTQRFYVQYSVYSSIVLEHRIKTT